MYPAVGPVKVAEAVTKMIVMLLGSEAAEVDWTDGGAAPLAEVEEL